jgi:hypothetical protein
MKKNLLIFFWMIVPVLGNVTEIRDAEYRIVFVHLGPHLPTFLSIALAQAHAFCPTAEILLIAHKNATGKENLREYVTLIHAEDILKTKEHEQFNQLSTLDKGFREGFWHYATERLFYLDDLITQFNLKNTFHLENDNLLYVDLAELLPIFMRNYSGIAAPFESDNRGFASFIFIPDKECIHALAYHLRQHARSGQNEMHLLNSFKNAYGPAFLDHLPTTTQEYVANYGLRNISGAQCSIEPGKFYNHIDEFDSIFDGAAHGQYLGGIDPRNAPIGPGFINEESFFNPRFLTYIWINDALGRKIPYVIFQNKKFRINNLHIHSKNLIEFASFNTEM